MVASGFGGLVGLGIEWGRAARTRGARPTSGSLEPSRSNLAAARHVAGGRSCVLGANGRIQGSSSGRRPRAASVSDRHPRRAGRRGALAERAGHEKEGSPSSASSLRCPPWRTSGKLREGSLFFQDASGYVSAELGALEVAGDSVDPLYVPTRCARRPSMRGHTSTPSSISACRPTRPAKSGVGLSRFRQAADTVLVQALRIGPFKRPPELVGLTAAGRVRRGESSCAGRARSSARRPLPRRSRSRRPPTSSSATAGPRPRSTAYAPSPTRIRPRRTGRWRPGRPRRSRSDAASCRCLGG